MILATLDTNILASGARKLGDSASTPGQILERWIEGEFVLVCSAPILSELERTLHKSYFRQHLTDDQVDVLLQMLPEQAMIVSLGIEVHGVASHAEDDLILATAVNAGADFLVTGDHALLELQEHAGVRIISARAFLTILEQKPHVDR